MALIQWCCGASYFITPSTTLQEGASVNQGGGGDQRKGGSYLLVTVL